MHDVVAPDRPAAHPFLFLILYLPFGVTGGFLAYAVAYPFTHAGVSTVEFTALAGLYFAPQTFKMLWAPLVDTTLTSKAWYLISLAIAAPALAAVGFLPMGRAALPILAPLAVLMSVAASLTAMASERMMALATLPTQQGRAGGWSQAGNVGGAGLGGGAGLWMASHLHPFWISSCIVAVVMAACALALLLVPETARPPRRSTYVAALGEVLRDCWSVMRSRTGAMALLILILPIGTSTFSNVAGAVAKEWRASADLVSSLAGTGGIITAISAILSGWLCDRMGRKTAYAVFGLFQAAVAVVMAFGPKTPEFFAITVYIYAATIGFTYAAFAALTLEAIGAGAAATKFNLFACFSNIPIFYVTLIEGYVDTRWRVGAMLNAEAGLCVLGVIVFALIYVATPGRTAPALAA